MQNYRNLSKKSDSKNGAKKQSLTNILANIFAPLFKEAQLACHTQMSCP